MALPILCLDFDGVIHSYKSGWKGPRIIPDPPVPGALEFIVQSLEKFDVQIYSSRSHYWFGRAAMKNWLHNWLCALAQSPGTTPEWWAQRIWQTSFADPWEEEVDYAARLVVNSIKWPLRKPPAMVTIDDRAITFTGEWPSTESLLSFKPWNKKV